MLFYNPRPARLPRPRTYPELLAGLTAIARKGAYCIEVARFIMQQIPEAEELNSIGRIRRAWLRLPTYYRPDLDDYHQEVAETIITGLGDCEDSTTAQVSILVKLGIDARVAVMPGHAAVVVPVGSELGELGWRPVPSNALPQGWLILRYRERLWLPLETTIHPENRRVPGQGTADMCSFALSGQLHVGRSILESLFIPPQN